jgi:glutathione S-transferase
MMPLFFAMLLLAGVRHPAAAAGLGVAYTVARFLYFKGYATGAPRNRMVGYVHVASACGDFNIGRIGGVEFVGESRNATC